MPTLGAGGNGAQSHGNLIPHYQGRIRSRDHTIGTGSAGARASQLCLSHRRTVGADCDQVTGQDGRVDQTDQVGLGQVGEGAMISPGRRRRRHGRGLRPTRTVDAQDGCCLACKWALYVAYVWLCFVWMTAGMPVWWVGGCECARALEHAGLGWAGLGNDGAGQLLPSTQPCNQGPRLFLALSASGRELQAPALIDMRGYTTLLLLYIT